MDGALIDKVRRKLRITYEDDDNNARIEDIAEQADSALRDRLGIHDADFQWTDGGKELELFLAYCFYEYNDAADDFDANYAALIAQARERWVVTQYVEEEAAD